VPPAFFQTQLSNLTPCHAAGNDANPVRLVTILFFFQISQNRAKHAKSLYNQKSFKIEPANEKTLQVSLSLSL